MEWLIEGIALIFTGIIVAAVTAVEPLSPLSSVIYILCAVFLAILATVSLFTGFKVNFLPFKLCPVMFSVSAFLILIGWKMM